MSEQLSEADLIRKVVEPQIVAADWHPNGILQQPVISDQGLGLRPDFVLIHEWYPLTVVEVKRSDRFHESEALEQAKHYAETIGLPLAIATNGTQFISLNLENGTQKSWEKFPGPQDLWTWLGRTLDTKDDPRLYPVSPNSPQPRLFQAVALGKALDALLSGVKRGIISMVQGSGSSSVIADVVHKCIHSNFYQRILYVSDLRQDLDFLGHIFKGNGDSYLIRNQAESLDYLHPIHLATTSYLTELKDLLESEKQSSDFYNLILIRDSNNVDKHLSALDYFPESAVLLFSSQPNRKLLNFSGETIFEYSIENAVVDISPPEGFKIIPLEDIAEITVGLSLSKVSDYVSVSEGSGPLAKDQSYLLNGRDILDDGAINFNEARRIQFTKKELGSKNNKFLERYLAQPGDILMSSVTNFAHRRIALLPDNIQGNILFAQSVVRIRVDQTKAKPVDVFNFLRSDSGQRVIQRFSSSLAGMTRYLPSTLRRTSIFLPEQDDVNNVEDLDTTAIIVRQLKNEILPSLERLEKPSEHNKLEPVDIEIIACQLHQIAYDLVPRPLAERVMNQYPTPIAIACKRFRDSRFNVYEQVQRLRDVYEAASFFIYNLIFADFVRRLDPNKFYIEDKGSRRAYNSYSMAQRIDFVKEVIDIAKPTNGLELFIPELVSSEFPQFAEQLKDLRNSISHTATVTESRLRKILDDYSPLVDTLLSSLEFLEDYRIVRVPSFYRKKGKLTCRIEVYQGTVPTLDEETESDDFPLDELEQAEYNHLVMLNSSGQILDLHPFYQLVEDERTQYESHICFFKQCRQKEKKLEGESIQNSAIVQLGGFDDFSSLVSKIVDQPPASNV